MLGLHMEPQSRPSLQYAEAGGVLIGGLFACVALGGLIGWFAGSVGIGILIGAVVGIPMSIFTVYRRYRDAF
jgi:F0F1-type ATP synthase assembly protein I